MTPKPAHQPPRAIGYIRVSTDQQEHSGLGLDAQRSVITAEAVRRGWTVSFISDAGSGKNMDRAGIKRALADLDAGRADILVVAKLDRLSRSVVQGAALIEQAQRNGWSLVALDLGLDMSTPSGEMAANMVLSVAQYERRLISQRTKDALAAKKAKGERVGGGTTQLPDATIQQIVALRRLGMSMAAIAAWLEYRPEEYPTARAGTHWHASTVRAVLLSQRAAELVQ